MSLAVPQITTRSQKPDSSPLLTRVGSEYSCRAVEMILQDAKRWKSYEMGCFLPGKQRKRPATPCTKTRAGLPGHGSHILHLSKSANNGHSEKDPKSSVLHGSGFSSTCRAKARPQALCGSTLSLSPGTRNSLNNQSGWKRCRFKHILKVRRKCCFAANLSLSDALCRCFPHENASSPCVTRGCDLGSLLVN
jgi:hypothetical protein